MRHIKNYNKGMVVIQYDKIRIFDIGKRNDI